MSLCPFEQFHNIVSTSKFKFPYIKLQIPLPPPKLRTVSSMNRQFYLHIFKISYNYICVGSFILDLDPTPFSFVKGLFLFSFIKALFIVFLLLLLVVDINCDICARLFSAADRCFPRARLQTHAGTAITRPIENLCSCWSQRYSAPNTMLATEIHEDSLKKKTAFSACDVSHRSFPCPAGKRRR